MGKLLDDALKINVSDRDKFTSRMMSNLDGEKDAQIAALRHALGDIRIFANGPGDRRAVIDKIYEIATKVLRASKSPTSEGWQCSRT